MFVAKFLIRLLTAVIAILLPLLIGRYWNRKHDSPWSLFRTGCLTFVVSQVFHIPFNFVVFNLVGVHGALPEGTALVYFSIFLGLSAGVFEETTRYVAYRYRLTSPNNRTFRAALMFGTGHGGMESILLVGLGGIGQLIAMTILRGKDPETMGIPSDQVEMFQKQIHEYWSMPWYGVLLADLERIFTMIIHVALTVLVLQCFRGSQSTSRLWIFLLAILWHAGLDSLVVLLSTKYNMYLAETVVAIWAIASLGILRYLHEQDEGIETYDEIVVAPPSIHSESEPLTETTEEAFQENSSETFL